MRVFIVQQRDDPDGHAMARATATKAWKYSAGSRRSVISVGMGLPAKQAPPWMARASPVFAG